jgi:hypothetical protein
MSALELQRPSAPVSGLVDVDVDVDAKCGNKLVQTRRRRGGFRRSYLLAY